MEEIETSYNNIIKWLENHYKNKPNIKTYRGFEYSPEFTKDVKSAKKGGIEFSIDPMLPIDLLAVEKKKEIDDKTEKRKLFSYYTLFWLVSKDNPDLERRLQFYRFYLSRISKLKGVQIIMVIPANTPPGLKKSLHKIAKENGFGLWRVDLSQTTPEELCTPKDFRERMEDIFLNPLKKMTRFKEPIIRKKAGNITLFFDGFVREAVEAMVGITPKQVGKRFIERIVLDLVFELENISYSEMLRGLVTQHLEQKGDDYDFVSKIFANLWEKCELEMDYSEFLKNSEPPLHNIFTRANQEKPYRDHYLHQFQVFLLGLYIIDKLYSKFPPDIEKQWLISSSFHDMAYPIQLYDSWAKVFFDKSLGVPEIGVTDMKSHFVDKTLLSCMGDIINLLCKLHFGRVLQGNWLAKEKELVRFFHEKITKVKHHCVLSSVFLLKQADKLKSSLLNDLFVPSALAIALHHEEVWKELSLEHKLSILKFENDPLSFLLLFCDAAQEWGRPKDIISDRPKAEEENFILEKFSVTKSKCLVIIKAPYLLDTDDIFKEKMKQLEKLKGFLQSPSFIEFQITLKDKTNAKKEYRMLGHKE